MDHSMERKFLKTTVAGILLEIGFHSAEPAALETLVEMICSGKFDSPPRLSTCTTDFCTTLLL